MCLLKYLLYYVQGFCISTFIMTLDLRVIAKIIILLLVHSSIVVYFGCPKTRSYYVAMYQPNSGGNSKRICRDIEHQLYDMLVVL